ncbi:MAG: hypothetical protein MH219_14290 [Marinobacter sp.]|nr:hypothetical protein [Marinobacter sp.]MCL1482031.1 hypothetical protein [Marinobacter sp.]
MSSTCSKLGSDPPARIPSAPCVPPMILSRRFATREMLEQVRRIEIHLFGSLSATGVGHGTDRAAIMGLMGEQPQTIDPVVIGPTMEALQETQTLLLDARFPINFNANRDMQWHSENLLHHPNAMRVIAHTHSDELYRNTYYSVGGGFVIDEAQAAQGDFDTDTTPSALRVQYGG